MNPAEFGTPEFFALWLQIVVLDLVLAGDNALVIALAVRNLTPKQQWQGRIWGTMGAVGLRLAFIAVVTYLLSVPLLQAAGGLALLWIAVKLLNQDSDGHNVRHGSTLLQAIWIIVVADVVMSLDNVLAVAGAAHGDMFAVLLGVGISIPIVIWGSSLISLLLTRFSWLVDLGAGILGWVAGRMILHDAVVSSWLGGTPPLLIERGVQLALAASVVALGRWLGSRAKSPEDSGSPA